MPHAELAQRILNSVAAHPDAFDPTVTFECSSHAIWPEDDIDANDIVMGLAAWTCHLMGWHLTRGDMGQPYAYEPDADDDDRHDLTELAADLLDLDDQDLLDEVDRDTVIAGLRRIADPRDQVAQETAEYIAGVLAPRSAAFHAQPDVHVHYVDGKRPPTDVADIKATLLGGSFWLSWMDDKVTAAMTAIHGPYQDPADASV